MGYGDSSVMFRIILRRRGQDFLKRQCARGKRNTLALRFVFSVLSGPVAGSGHDRACTGKPQHPMLEWAISRGGSPL